MDIDLGVKMKPGWSNDPRIQVDPEDAWVLEYKWTLAVRGHTTYAMRNDMLLHRFIMNAPPGVQVDHVNHDGLDNRRCNLRLATHSENCRNQKLSPKNTSGYKGVSWYSPTSCWRTDIRLNGRNKYVGYYATPEEAARAYDHKAIELYGEFALTNEMLGLYPWQKDEAAD